jgi:hypothetical protein
VQGLLPSQVDCGVLDIDSKEAMMSRAFLEANMLVTPAIRLRLRKKGVMP